jgi:hypothetical protein
LGTAKTITLLTNSLIIIWREGYFAHVARNLLLVEFIKSGAHKILAGSSPTLTQYVPTLEKFLD